MQHTPLKFNAFCVYIQSINFIIFCRSTVISRFLSSEEILKKFLSNPLNLNWSLPFPSTPKQSYMSVFTVSWRISSYKMALLSTMIAVTCSPAKIVWPSSLPSPDHQPTAPQVLWFFSTQVLSWGTSGLGTGAWVWSLDTTRDNFSLTLLIRTWGRGFTVILFSFFCDVMCQVGYATSPTVQRYGSGYWVNRFRSVLPITKAKQRPLT